MARPSLGAKIFIVSQDESSWDEEAHSAREAGAEHIAIYLEYPPGNGRLRERQLRRLRNLLKGRRLLLEAPSSWPSLITPHEGLFRLSLEELKETLKVGPPLGAELCILHGGATTLRVGPEAAERLREGLHQLASLARELGLTLTVENLARGYPARAGELEEALALIPGLKLSLDLAQARAGGEEPVELLQRFVGTGRVARVTLEPEEEIGPLLPYLEGVAFLTLAGGFPSGGPSTPGSERWGLVREGLLRLKTALGGGSKPAPPG